MTTSDSNAATTPRVPFPIEEPKDEAKAKRKFQSLGYPPLKLDAAHYSTALIGPLMSPPGTSDRGYFNTLGLDCVPASSNALRHFPDEPHRGVLPPTPGPSGRNWDHTANRWLDLFHQKQVKDHLADRVMGTGAGAYHTAPYPAKQDTKYGNTHYAYTYEYDNWGEPELDLSASSAPKVKAKDLTHLTEEEQAAITTAANSVQDAPRE